jgi:PAS domain S-box-containing protein
MDAAKLLEAAPDAMIMVETDGTILHASHQALALFGYTRDELIGKPIDLLVPERYRTVHPGHRVRYFSDPGAPPRPMGADHLDLFGLKKDGREFLADISLSQFEDEGRMVALVAVRDLTGRRIAEEAKQKLAQAEEAVRVRDEFLSIASHELKTPLTVLRMQMDSLVRMYERGDAVGFAKSIAHKLGVMRDSSHRLTELIERLLNISRITSGRLELQTATVDLAGLVRGVVTHFEDQMARAGCRYSLDARKPVMARIDALRVEQVVINLFSNAIKYGGGKLIEIKVYKTAEAVFSVRDHGIGIAPEHQALVFDKFERVVSSRNYGGFGLGLWISRQLVEAHGGRIEVSSELGAGSLFTVYLPMEGGSR